MNDNISLLQIDIFHSDEPLKDFFTLMDIAYIYTWRRVSERIKFLTIFGADLSVDEIWGNIVDFFFRRHL